jgi:hypothetical protein
MPMPGDFQKPLYYRDTDQERVHIATHGLQRPLTFALPSPLRIMSFAKLCSLFPLVCHRE